jgi:hypothetical protein
MRKLKSNLHSNSSTIHTYHQQHISMSWDVNQKKRFVESANINVFGPVEIENAEFPCTRNDEIPRNFVEVRYTEFRMIPRNFE